MPALPTGGATVRPLPRDRRVRAGRSPWWGVAHHSTRQFRYAATRASRDGTATPSRRDVTISAASTTMICCRCELSGGPYTADEAALHVATHDRLHHGRRATAFAWTSDDVSANVEAA